MAVGSHPHLHLGAMVGPKLRQRRRGCQGCPLIRGQLLALLHWAMRNPPRAATRRRGVVLTFLGLLQIDRQARSFLFHHRPIRPRTAKTVDIQMIILVEDRRLDTLLTTVTRLDPIISRHPPIRLQLTMTYDTNQAEKICRVRRTCMRLIHPRPLVRAESALLSVELFISKPSL